MKPNKTKQNQIELNEAKKTLILPDCAGKIASSCLLQAENMADKRQVLYLLRHATEPHFKIGIAVDPTVRAGFLSEKFDLSKSFFVPCGKFGAFRVEQALHMLFSNYRVDKPESDGHTEWFHVECLDRVRGFLEEHGAVMGCAPLTEMSRFTALQERSRTERPSGEQESSLHVSIQGKGRIGKTLVSLLLARYFRSGWRKVECWDADPLSRTWARQCGAGRIALRPRSTDARETTLDALFDKVRVSGYRHILDCGPMFFFPFLENLGTLDLEELLKECAISFYVHVILGGGDCAESTRAGLSLIRGAIPDKYLVIWVNHHLGGVEPPSWISPGRVVNLCSIAAHHLDRLTILDEWHGSEQPPVRADKTNKRLESEDMFSGAAVRGVEDGLFPQLARAIGC